MNIQSFFMMRRLALEVSPIHRAWKNEDFVRLFTPALENEQCAILPDGGGFVTWAWLTKEALDGFLSRTRKLQPKDWKAGENLVMIDCVARPGKIAALIRLVRKHFKVGQIATGTRTYGTGKVQRVTRWAHVV